MSFDAGRMKSPTVPPWQMVRLQNRKVLPGPLVIKRGWRIPELNAGWWFGTWLL